MMTPYNSRPATRDDVCGGQALHNDCGGAVQVQVYGGYFGIQHYGPYECAKCHQKWTQDAIEKRLTSDDLSKRFHVRVEALDWPLVLVWVTEGKQRFTRLVSPFAAAGLERVKG